MTNKVDGITLLQMIKNKEIKDKTKIREYYLGVPTKHILFYNNGNLEWIPGEFLVGDLCRNDYTFEIIEEIEKPNIPQKISFNTTETQKEKNRLMKDTINQIIDYLKKEDDKE